MPSSHSTAIGMGLLKLTHRYYGEPSCIKKDQNNCRSLKLNGEEKLKMDDAKKAEMLNVSFYFSLHR